MYKPEPIYNEYGEELERIGDIVLNTAYWDCECQSDDYIHPVSKQTCDRCGAVQEEQPNTRELDVQDLRDRVNYGNT